MVAILVMSANLTTLDLLKIKVFQNKGYGVVISVHDVTSKIFVTSLKLYYRCGHVTKV